MGGRKNEGTKLLFSERAILNNKIVKKIPMKVPSSIPRAPAPAKLKRVKQIIKIRIAFVQLTSLILEKIECRIRRKIPNTVSE
jgi:hypothetical protein